MVHEKNIAKQTDVRYSTTRPHLYIVALLTFHIVKKHVFFIKYFFYSRFLPYRFINAIIFCH